MKLWERAPGHNNGNQLRVAQRQAIRSHHDPSRDKDVEDVGRTLRRPPLSLYHRPIVVFPKDSLDRERIVSAAPVDDDASFELKLRPQRLREFIGQDKVKNNLEIAIQAAKSRGEALDHVLLYGPPGLGKTTLANIIANELGAAFQQTSGPTLQIKGDLTAVLTNLRDKQVLFIDEVHRMQPVLEELLYSALEDYKLDIIIGQGPSARTHTIEVRPFTFIGATTRAGLLSAPLRSRFGIVLRLEFYTHADLMVILERSAEILGVAIDEPAAIEIATRCRGTPRIANRLLRRVRDYAQVRGTGNIDKPTAQAALEMLEVDRHGFDEIDRKLLLTIIEKYQGGPVGLNTLAASLAEEADAIEEIYEPFLIQIGFLDRTPRGRVATHLAYQHFGIRRPKTNGAGQETLF
jgi:holliday junction DNA helicase RuvB